MAKYIDFCLIPFPKKDLAKYKKTTTSVGKILLKHGALASRDYVADDENATKKSIPTKIKLKVGEVVIVAIAEFKSKAHRDKVFKLMHNDPAMEKIMQNMTGDHKRMLFGGFKTLVDLE